VIFAVDVPRVVPGGGGGVVGLGLGEPETGAWDPLGGTG
jgi:hypothetical protein